MSEDKADPPGSASADDQGAALARRRLLKLGAYVAPAIVGTLLLTEKTAAAASCLPQSLCNPNCGPCQPACFPHCSPG